MNEKTPHHGRFLLTWLDPVRTALFLSVIFGVLTAVYALIRFGMGALGWSKIKLTLVRSLEWVVSMGLFSFLLTLIGVLLCNWMAGTFGGLPYHIESEESEETQS